MMKEWKPNIEAEVTQRKDATGNGETYKDVNQASLIFLG
jgi:hypothetical protein